jgi:hypothetical protein
MSILSALNEPRLRLAEALAARGVRLGADPAEAYGAALATRRCVFCTTKKECDAWLASGRREGFEDFCPNAWYIARRS